MSEQSDNPLRLFDRLGGVFYALILGTVVMTLWWAGRGIATLLGPMSGAMLLGLAGVAALLVTTPRLAGLPAVVLAGLALVDRTGAGWPVWALALYAVPVGLICLGVVTYALARHVPRAARALPQVLVLVLGVLFILPVTLLQGLMGLFRRDRG